MSYRHAIATCALRWATARGQILSSLVHLKYIAPSEVIPALRNLILKITSEAATKLQTQAELVRTHQWPMIAQALEWELREDRSHLLKLLSFLPNCQALRDLEKELQSSLRAQRARALELLETLVPAEFKALVPLFLDDLTLEQQAQRIASVFNPPSLSHEQRLIALADDPIQHLLRWTKTCALHEIGRSRIAAGQGAARGNLTSTEPILQQTAEWTVQQLCL